MYSKYFVENACKALILAAPTGAFCSLIPARGFLLAIRERVGVFPYCQLVVTLIFFELILDILCNLFRVLSCCIHVISSVPEAPISVFVFLSSISVVNQKPAFPFEKSYESYYLRSLWTVFLPADECGAGHTSSSKSLIPFQLHSSRRIFPISALCSL